ncbi:hypothetical protein [Krasilnikovia sp. MM14-A1004]|uniref:hypothetical protein n=1 Tax=Krasilnikovia sp. MM14-A1004 TaxID=3373541 RepID=UPI00399C6B8B
MSGDGLLVRALVACYPARWRRRYGEEYAQLLCDLGIHRHPLLIMDSLSGAARAHGGVLVSHDSPMTAVVWAAGLFTVGGLGFAKLAEDVSGDARGMYMLMVLAAAAAMLALMVAAAPTALALIRGGHRNAWGFVAVPFVAASAWYGILRLALAISAGHEVRSAPNVAGFVLIAAATIGVVTATAWAASEVLRRVPAAQPARLGPVARIIVAAGMAVATFAALVWGLQVRSHDAAGFRGDHGILATPFVFSWIVVVVVLAAATALAALTNRRPAALA